MPLTHHMAMTITQSIPDRSQPGLTMTAPSAAHQDGGDKCATGGTNNKIRGRDDIIIGTWNVRTLRAEGKLEELTHEMDRYNWHILGLCEMRWKHFGEMSTKEGHKVYYSGKADKHEYGVGFLVHKNIVKTVMGCRPISSRLITIRLQAKPFNITIIQVYAPTSNHDDHEVENFYLQLQDVINQAPKSDILVVQGDWNAKVGEDSQTDWQGTCGPYCNAETNERGLMLLEFATYNNLMLANTFGPHKASRRQTWHSPDGKHHNQIDYILVKKRFRSGVNLARTRSFPGADIGSDHDLLMMTFHLRLKKISKPKYTRVKFDLEKLKDPAIAETFQAMIGGKFAALSVLGEEDSNVDSMITVFNTVMTDTASEILGKHHQSKKPWVTTDILELCDKRRELKQGRKDPEGAERYRDLNRQIRKRMKEAKEKWINEQCNEIEVSLSHNNSKKAYQVVKDLTTEKQGRAVTIKDKAGKSLTEEQDILQRWTEYCSELYNHKTDGDPSVLNCPQATENEQLPILHEEVEAAVKTLKKGKSPGSDNIPAELVQAGGDALINTLTTICNKIWQSGEWPTPWTQSLIIPLPKKGNLQNCQNYQTISLISHPY